MNAKGWEETGRKMVESFNKHWPCRLTVYAEGFVPDLDVDVRSMPAWQEDWKRVYGIVPEHVGRKNGRYDYSFDAVKFSHKVAALTDFAENISEGVVICLDADTITHAPVT
jgi:hypothetical protein